MEGSHARAHVSSLVIWCLDLVVKVVLILFFYYVISVLKCEFVDPVVYLAFGS